MTEEEIIAGLDFGRAEAILNNRSDNPMTALLLSLTNELIADLRKEIIDNRATGNLEQSIIPTAIAPDQIDVTAPDYWKYLNYGVNGTKVKKTGRLERVQSEQSLSQALKKWIVDKGIQVPTEIGIDQLTYLITRKIKLKGTEGVHFYENVVTPERIQEMSKPISNLLKQSIITIIKKPTT